MPPTPADAPPRNCLPHCGLLATTQDSRLSGFPCVNAFGGIRRVEATGVSCAAPTPLLRAWYGASIADFLTEVPAAVAGSLRNNSDFDVLASQRDAWMAQNPHPAQLAEKDSRARSIWSSRTTVPMHTNQQLTKSQQFRTMQRRIQRALRHK